MTDPKRAPLAELAWKAAFAREHGQFVVLTAQEAEAIIDAAGEAIAVGCSTSPARIPPQPEDTGDVT